MIFKGKGVKVKEKALGIANKLGKVFGGGKENGKSTSSKNEQALSYVLFRGIYVLTVELVYD